MVERHFDVKEAEELDSAERLRELRPQELLTQLGRVRRRRMTCVDLGSGTGVFALPLAEMAGSEGTVYAVDDSRAMLDRLKGRRPPPQVKLVKTDVTRTGLPSGNADFCLLAFILHEVETPESLVAEAFRLLKPGGRVLVMEWKAEKEAPPGPPRSIRLDRKRVEGLLTGTGFIHLVYRDWSANYYAVTAVKM
ncbi:MAG: class I SAM-dependent methyltransferase [Chloroflexi bacterium]|nr:class I SAM-dependent methyltransferase [Chloroflexota bacterium]